MYRKNTNTCVYVVPMHK